MPVAGLPDPIHDDVSAVIGPPTRAAQRGGGQRRIHRSARLRHVRQFTSRLRGLAAMVAPNDFPKTGGDIAHRLWVTQPAAWRSAAPASPEASSARILEATV